MTLSGTGTALALVIGCTFTAASSAAQAVTTPRVAANDNRRAAGTIASGTIAVSLVAATGRWQPEKDDGPVLDVAAFGEDGGPLLTPGPLLRAVEGTEMVVRVKNTLSEPLRVHGLVTRPAGNDVVLTIPAGETREARFPVGAPGTYYYWATTAASVMSNRNAFESQLGGAMVVDARGSNAADRVLVMTEWDDSPIRVDELVNQQVRRVFAINGYSWPHTEVLEEHVGRPARWRIVNLTQVAHPMHLHGFYFAVQAVGTGLRDTVYEAADHRQAVTEFMRVGSTMQMTWTPDRPGQWLWHCHLVSHVTPALRFWTPAAATTAHTAHGEHDAASAMAGMVMGIRVTGESPAPVVANPGSARQMTLVMNQRRGYWQPEDAYTFSLGDDTRDRPLARPEVPGPLLVLKRNEPVEITLKNELPEPSAIHWHGIELESYFDGVPGWSGSSPTNTTPVIEPGGAFVVRFTPPRAGTFIYHTHFHDARQLASGLYGAIVVLEAGETFDPARDHVLVLGMEGPKDPQTSDMLPVVVNGSRRTELTLKSGVPNRLRLINVTTNFSGLNVSAMAGNQPLAWRPVAKDGAALPPHQQSARPAVRQQVGVGETYDFLVDPPRAGQTFIEVRRAGGEWVQQVPVRVVP